MTRREISAHRMIELVVNAILDNGDSAIIDGSYYDEISPYVEQDTTDVKSPEDLAERLCREGARELLDFGCGTGDHREMLEEFGYRWRGVNYRDGMALQAASTADTDDRILFYDGRTLPFPDEEFDVVYSFQVFEHLQDIKATFSEIRRVLKPGGSLVGSVSYLEQIHDYSTFNFTPYGFKLACDDEKINPIKLYPRYDAFTFLLRRLMVVTTGSDENSLTAELVADNSIGKAFVDYGSRLGIGAVETNLLRMMFSTSFAFHARRD